MAKPILKVKSAKLSDDIDDYLSDEFTDEDLTPPKDDGKNVNLVNGKKADVYDDLSYSDDDSVLSQERYQNSKKQQNDEKSAGKSIVSETKEREKVAISKNDGPRVMSSEEEIRYFLDPLDDGEIRDPTVSTKTLIKTQDVRTLVTNQNKLLDNLGGMKRDIGNLDKEIDVIRSQIRSSAVINDATSNIKPATKKTSSGNTLSSRRSISGVSSASTPGSRRNSTGLSTSRVPAGMSRLSRADTSRARNSLFGAGVLGGTRTGTTLSGGYVPGSYMARKTSSTTIGLGDPLMKYKPLPRATSLPPPPSRLRYIPVGTVTVTTHPRTYTTSYHRPVYGAFDDLDETPIGTYLNTTYIAPHNGRLTNRVFDSLYSTSRLY